MKVGFAADHESPFTDGLVRELRERFAGAGHELLDTAPDAIPQDVGVVVNVTRAEAPRANYLRSRPSNFVCTIAEAASTPDDLRTASYKILVQTMSNLLVHAVPDGRDGASYMVTPELGFRRVPHDEEHARAIADKVLAISDVTYVIDNDLVPDLPERLWRGDGVTASLARVGAELDSLGLLPSVLPLEQLLSERERRLLMKVFGVKQLSYGNLSARRDAGSFWMTGRGVDKSRLSRVGRDMLLVVGLDEAAGRVRLSVPPGTDESSRVSVDAVEHALIYRARPKVGAIIHVHAWMPGIESTLQNYPCGTVDLAREVLALVERAPDPDNAVVGLLNHGITATGPDLEAVFGRIAGRLERQVPMS